MSFGQRHLIQDKELVEFYQHLLLPRLIEEKMLVLLRQGKISKWFSGIGQEAISVGATLAMNDDEWIFPLHRNLGVFTTRNMPLKNLFRQWQGAYDGFSKGRERSFHFGSKDHFICGMISHLGPQLTLATGTALAYKLNNQPKCSLAFTGDGGTSEGDFHEALNLAAVWDLPVIFLIENNGYGLSTPTNEQYRCDRLVDRARGYGMKGVQIDGNNLVEVYNCIKDARHYCISLKKPILIEAMTFRMRGHEEASGVKYVPKEYFEHWTKKDPIKQFENYLKIKDLVSDSDIENTNAFLKEYIEKELERAFDPDGIELNEENEINDLFAKKSTHYFNYQDIPPDVPKRKMRFIEAISDGLKQSLQLHPNLIIMGQDIAEYGGAFKVTENFVSEFGKDRIRNTPICESVVVGAALGLSLENIKAIMEMQFADFATVGFNQIVNNLAKIHYRWGQQADVVIRMPTGGGIGAGPFHSQSNEAWFTHTPGLKVVYPSNPIDAKGLLISAINDPNPVIYFEHKALYRSIDDFVSETYYEIPIGKAKVIAEGNTISVITYGMGVHWIKQFQAEHPDISIYILDLRTLAPLDYDAIKQAVTASGKVLLLHEDTLIGGIGGEIAAWISEHCFEFLDGPVLRCASLDTPIPFNLKLEKQFLAQSRLEKTIQKLLKY